MSLDRILFSIDNLLVDISGSVNRLLNTLTIFLPVFIISFALLVLVLIALLVITLLLQLKRLKGKQNGDSKANHQDPNPNRGTYKPANEFGVDLPEKSGDQTQKADPHEFLQLKKPKKFIRS